jgi:hypothetical protein
MQSEIFLSNEILCSCGHKIQCVFAIINTYILQVLKEMNTATLSFRLTQMWKRTTEDGFNMFGISDDCYHVIA